MTKQMYAISVATALGLGYVTGFTSDNILAQTSHSYAKEHTVSKVYLSSNPTITDIWTKAKNVACDDADASIPMDAGTCANMMNPCALGTTLTMSCIQRTHLIDDDADPETPMVPEIRDETSVNVNFKFNGNWVPTVQ